MIKNTKVKTYFESVGLSDRLNVWEHTCNTTEHAAETIGCEPAQIAKTLSFYVEDQPVLIVVTGDAKVDNRKYRDQFQVKARMIPWDAVEAATGFSPGGVCPFGVDAHIKAYLDVSLKRFQEVYPAAGDQYCTVKLSPEEIEAHANIAGWVDVCKGWQEQSIELAQ
jgi:prolyl-tRNA editing enzyme YbaK/EbsC (Cys-tRNA(Pro) deacylase)